MCFGWGTDREAMILFDSSGSMLSGALLKVYFFHEVFNGFRWDQYEQVPQHYNNFPYHTERVWDWFLEHVGEPADSDRVKQLRHGIWPQTACRCPGGGAAHYFNLANDYYGSSSADQLSPHRLEGRSLQYPDGVPETDGNGVPLDDREGRADLPEFRRFPDDWGPQWSGTEGPWVAMRAAAYLWDKEEWQTLPPEAGGPAIAATEDEQERPTIGGRPLLNGDGKGLGWKGGYHEPYDRSQAARTLIVVGDEFTEELLRPTPGPGEPPPEETQDEYADRIVSLTIAMLREARIRVLAFPTFGDGFEAFTGVKELKRVALETGGLFLPLGDLVPAPGVVEDRGEFGFADPDFEIPPDVVRGVGFVTFFGGEIHYWTYWLDREWYDGAMPLQVKIIDYVKALDDLPYDQPAPAWPEDAP